MHLRTFWLPLAVSAVSACNSLTPQEHCAIECAGCCSSDGVCQSGDSTSACGAGGFLCVACPGGQVCSAAKSCAVSMQGAGGGAAGTGGGSAGGTACTPETDAELCSAANKACGPHTATDRCGASRTIVNCASCASGKTCFAGACICQPESNAAYCARQGKSCGTFSGTDNCGAGRSASCGSCTGGNTCNANVCSCAPETDTQFCTRANRSCGGFNGTDNCGQLRVVASCGSCVSPNTCSAAGACSCASETNVQFCARLGARCGPLSGTDACGQTRNVASCGGCSSGNACGGAGVPNQCGCTPKTDAELCAVRGKDCGTLPAVTDCGMTRTPSCGTCGGAQTCAGGGVANVCGCTAETHLAFCARVGATCGAVTAPDNCGTARTVASCGTCTSPQTCQPSSTCQCVPETDAQLCTRLSKTCGALSATDNCGASRSIASCGSCGPGTACGAATNRCIASTPLPASGVCTTNGFCWELPKTNYDDLNAVWVETSGVVWAAGDNGTVLRWDGTSVRGFRHLVASNLTAIWSSGAGEVWAGGADGTVLRFNGTVWEDLSFGGADDVLSIWGDGLGRVFVGGEGTLVRRYSNGQWTTPFQLQPDNSNDVISLMGWGAGMRILRDRGQYEWDGTSQTVTAISVLASYDWCRFTAQVQVGPNEGWAARYCFDTSDYNGWQQAYESVGPTVDWANLPSHARNGDAHFAARSPNEVYLFGGASRGWKFDGLTWTQASLGTTVNAKVTAGHGNAARAVFVGNQGALFGNTGAGWVSAAIDGFPPNVTAPSWQFVAPISDTRAVVQLSGTLSVWNNGAWVGTTALTSAVAGAWSPDGTTAFALATSPPALYRFNGSTWSVAGTLPAGDYSSLSGTSATDLWVSGVGKMMHWNGAAFAEVQTPYSGTTTKLGRLVAVSPSLAWVRADTGQLLEWNGTSWALETGVTAPVKDQPMWKSPSGAVWALTAAGPMRYAAGAWAPVPMPAGTTAGEQVWGTSDSAVNVSTTEGQACTWSGAAWSCAAMPPGFFVNQRVVATGSRTWLFAVPSSDGASRVMILRK